MVAAGAIVVGMAGYLFLLGKIERISEPTETRGPLDGPLAHGGGA
jgi:hypothetical protein